jgi:hypothetical protein
MDGAAEITAKSLRSMAMAKVFQQNKKSIISLDFDDTGKCG